jgi:hypothetical protein
VPEYRIFSFDQVGRTKGVPKIVTCADDTAATEEAWQLSDETLLEVWQNGRRVSVITAVKQYAVSSRRVTKRQLK